MRRILFSLASALSLLLCLTSVVVWARSHWVADVFGRRTPGHVLEVRAQELILSNGLIIFSKRHVWAQQMAGRWGLWFEAPERHTSISPPPPDYPDQGVAGFGSSHRLTPGPLSHSYDNIYAPIWSFTALFTVLPSIWIRQFSLKKRRRPGHCPNCGYDLTGNNSGTCPECGSLIVQRASALPPEPDVKSAA